MGQAEILELERLANKPELVASNAYDNPNRDGETFYNFVREYGHHTGISIEDRTTTFIEDCVNYWEQLNLWLRHDNGTPFNKFSEVSTCVLGLIVGPILYPLMGGSCSITNSGDLLTIKTPTYSGIWYLSTSKKTHEYMHAYHAIMARDFRNKGLIEIDGFHDVDHTELPLDIEVPSYEELKRFERRIIHQMIRTIVDSPEPFSLISLFLNRN